METSQSLDDALQGAFGSETPLEDASATSPSAAASGSSADLSASTGDAAGSPADAPAPDADVAAAESSESLPLTDVDLGTAVPLTYQVNGAPQTFEGLRVVEGVGGVIAAGDLPALQQRLAERDAYQAAYDAQARRVQDLDQLTEWKTTGPDGKETALRGSDALEAQRVLLGRTLATNSVLLEVLGDPAKLQMLLTVDPATERVVLDQTALEHLVTRAELMQDRAERAARQQFQGVIRDREAQHNQSGEAAQAPAQLWALAESQWLSQFPALTADDKQFLRDQSVRYIRSANAEEVRTGQFRQGQPVLDPSFHAVIKRQADLQSAAANRATATGTAAANAAKENAARQQAARAGQSTNGRPPVLAKPVNGRVEQARKTKVQTDQRFNLMNSLTSGHMPSAAELEAMQAETG